MGCVFIPLLLRTCRGVNSNSCTVALRIFAISVAVSSAAWAGVFLLLGVLFGDSIERSIRSSPLVYGGVAGAIVVVVLVFAFIRSRRQNQEEKRP